MAVLWQLDSAGTRYEVRSHGATRRLFSDGVFHSAWNPRTGLTGRAWDLFLAAAFTRSTPPARILVLGIGAGTALLQYRRFIDPVTLIGVDLDAVHIEVGREFFGLDASGAQLHEADARDWVAAWRGPPFDLVVDDLYSHRDGEPQRAVPMNGHWAGALSRLVAPGGVLAANFISGGELQASAQLRTAQARKAFAAGFRLQGPRDHNVVGVFCRSAASAAATRTRLRAIPQLDDRRSGGGLRYAMRRLW